MDTLLLDFYGLTLIHLTDPLSQVIQIVYVWYMIYIYIYKGKKAGWLSYSVMFSLWGWEENVLHERTLQSTHGILGVEREEPIEPGGFLLH